MFLDISLDYIKYQEAKMATQTSLWFRDLNGNSEYAHIALKEVYEVIVPIYNSSLGKSVTLQQFNESITSFKVFFDTCVFELSDAVNLLKTRTLSDG